MSAPSDDALRRTPLFDLHVSLGAKMVPFAGYEMPVQYPSGIMAEHNQTRVAAGLFDVSHMGQVRISGKDAATALERLVPGDIVGLAPFRQRYTQFTNETGGILDDLMVSRWGDDLFVVVNAACKADDISHLKRGLEGGARIEPLEDRALLALQGPAAADVLARLTPACRTQKFMSLAACTLDGISCLVTRSGYTGEDGFEISVPAESAEGLAARLLSEPEVKPIGLGARDSLRLEAGLCLYGHDIDSKTSPVEAGLTWSIGKRRRMEGGFPGSDVIRDQLDNGISKKRVGIIPEGRAPAREGTEITDTSGRRIGAITSGGFGPTVNGPIAMGYVETAASNDGAPLNLTVRGTPRAAKVAPMPFVAHRYYRG
ncbi:MAG TPA: glycine cleavage system aminomethyltransferase GcvT [Alphaproteobacteria bacterium]|nr:glycine cleavage system aminomethyltransferase GcvT [Alphaproteobacteria bacterium]